MEGFAELLERRIPDVVSTADLPAELAAEIDFLAGRACAAAESGSIAPSLQARAFVVAGDIHSARSLLSEIEPSDLTIHEVAAAAWAVSRAGPVDVAEKLMAVVEDLDVDFLGGDIPLGPTGTVLGLLRATVGDLPGSAVALRDAAVVGDARAPLWGALARAELGRVLTCAAAAGLGDDDDVRAEAQRAVVSARTFFVAGGYRSLLARLEETESVPADLGEHDPGRAVSTHPRLARLVPGARWTVGFGVQPAVSVRPSKGLQVLHHLVQNRHRPVSAVELSRLLDGGDIEVIAALTTSDVLAHLGADETDPTDLTARIREIFFDDSTRSRITKLVRRTVAKLRDTQPLLAEHLARTVRTGHACRYGDGARRTDVVWQL